MDDNTNIKNTITEVNQLRDLKMWNSLVPYFEEEVFVNDQELTKELPTRMKVKQLIKGWRSELKSYFYATRHRVGKLKINRKSKQEATVVAQCADDYYIVDRGVRYILTVEGEYKYHMNRHKSGWKIGQIEFKMGSQSIKPLTV